MRFLDTKLIEDFIGKFTHMVKTNYICINFKLGEINSEL